MCFRSMVGVLLVAQLALLGSGSDAKGQEDDSRSQTLDPQAVEVLQGSSEYIASVSEFHAKAESLLKINGQGISLDANTGQDLRVARPNKFVIQRRDSLLGGNATTVCDGESIYTLLENSNQFTTRGVPDSLSAAVVDDALVAGTGVILEKLLLSDSLHDEFLKDADELRYIGKESIADVSCHHLQRIKNDVATEIWIQSGDQPVIRRIAPDMQGTIKSMFANRTSSVVGAIESIEVEVTLTHWDAEPTFAENEFAFEAPDGAEEVRSLMSGDGRTDPTQLHALVGEQAPEFEVDLYGGGTVDLASHRDNDVVILDFWASWCGPCKRAMPGLIEVAEEFADQNVVLYAVNLRDDDDAIADFLEQEELKVAVPKDVDGKIGRAYLARAIPQTVIVGKDGKVQVVHIGASPDLHSRLSEELESLIAGKDLAGDARQLAAIHVIAEAAREPGSWTPPLNPDPQQILREAQADARAQRFEDALKKHVWFHHHALEHQPSLVGVRVSFALSYWKRLAQAYPPALDKLRDIRDESLEAAQNGNDAARQFRDFAAINRTLEEGHRTAEAFKLVDEQDPNLARALFSTARGPLVAAKEYELCGKYLRPERVLSSASMMLQQFSQPEDDAPKSAQARSMVGFYKNRFTNDVATVVGILVINDRGDEADKFAADAEKVWAKTGWDDEQFQAAIERAKEGTVPAPWP